MRSRWNTGSTWIAAVCVAVVVASVAAPALAGPDEGYIGVYMQRLTKDLRQGLDLDVSGGVLVTGVAKDGPAEAAGIEDGDVIVKFNDEAVNSPRHLRELVEAVTPAASAQIELVRDGELMTITLNVAEQPDDLEMWFDGDDFNHFGDLHRKWGGMNRFAQIALGPRLGVHATELNSDLADYFKTEPGAGVLVLDVEEKSVAADAGVKAGDVIQQIGDEEIQSIDDIRETIVDFDEGDEFTISVLRKGKKQSLSATMDDQDRTFVFNNSRVHPRRHHSPMRIHVDSDDLREELDELREELRELKRDLGRDEG